jgi:hypothetical protein
MFMRFVGGGIGHKSSDHIQQSTPNCVEGDAHDGAQDELEDVFPHNTQDQSQADEDVNADGDPDEVNANSDEEADYGYADSSDGDSDSECASEESEDSDDKAENGGEDEYDVL